MPDGIGRSSLRMKVEQILLFSDSQLGIEHDAEITVHLRFFAKAKRRQEERKTKSSKQAACRMRILDDEDCSPSLKVARTDWERREIEESFDIPEEFLQEMEAGCACELGDKLMAHSLLKKDDEKRLLIAFHETKGHEELDWLSHRIKNILVSRNLRLVGNIVREKFTNYIGQGVEKDDILQYGVEGLAHAIDKFDPTKDCRLSTYATRWIAQTIRRSLENESDLIRNPVHYHNYRCRIMQAEDDYLAETQSNEKPPMSYVCKKTHLSPEMIQYVNNAATCATSIDNPLDSNDETSMDFASVMSDETQDVESLAFESLKKEAVLRALRALTPRQAVVIELKFGFASPSADREEMSYTDISNRIGISVEEVKEAEMEALQELGKTLKFLMDDER